jgi:hypothetical protein
VDEGSPSNAVDIFTAIGAVCKIPSVDYSFHRAVQIYCDRLRAAPLEE